MIFTPSTINVVAAPVAVNVLLAADQTGEFGRVFVVATATVVVIASLISK